MKKFIQLFFIIFPLTTFCQSFHLDENNWYDFEGTIGTTEVQLTICPLENGQLKGNYCYKKYETKIKLVGQVQNDRIELTEIINDKPNGHFSGKSFTDNLDVFEGTWTDSLGSKAINFKLRLNSVCSGSPDNRYSDLYGTDEDVVKFLKLVKSSILDNNKQWIANHIAYPIKSTLYQGKKMTIKNKKQLIDNFERIFHSQYKRKIKSICVCNMFNNNYGVMLGNGEIWINNKPSATKDSFDYNITAINN